MSLTETYLRFSYLFHSASTTSFPPPPPLHSPSVLPPSPVRSRSPNYPTVAKSISSPLLVKRRLPTSFYGFRETIISFSSFLSKKRRSATDNISRYLSSSKEENKFFETRFESEETAGLSSPAPSFNSPASAIKFQL